MSSKEGRWPFGAILSRGGARVPDEPVGPPQPVQDVRRDVLEGALLSAQAQLRAAMQRANDAERRLAAGTAAQQACMDWVASALDEALPGAAMHALQLGSKEARNRVAALRSDPALAPELELLLERLPPSLREAIRAYTPDTAPTYATAPHVVEGAGQRREDECSTD